MRSRRRSRHWHDPEQLQGQAERDAQLGRSEFYVYVLDTDFGDYVGHSWHVGRRFAATPGRTGQIDRGKFAKATLGVKAFHNARRRGTV